VTGYALKNINKMMPGILRGVWSQGGASGTLIGHFTAFDATDIIVPIIAILIVLTVSMFHVYRLRAPI